MAKVMDGQWALTGGVLGKGEGHDSKPASRTDLGRNCLLMNLLPALRKREGDESYSAIELSGGRESRERGKNAQKMADILPQKK